jgi:hypothetical protein
MRERRVVRLEALKSGANIKGILPNLAVTVVNVHWIGSAAVELTYKDPEGQVANQLLYRDDEPCLELAAAGVPWAFDSDGALFRLVSEAHRIHLAYLFAPLLAVSTALVEPLPHQIAAVYEQMLPRQPLRYLLADDPGAGKTIMTGLLMKELRVRGDLQRCLVVCPDMLAEQWQDELWDRFHLPFEILTNDKLAAARTGNWFVENDLVIARLDKLSRNENVQAKLTQTDWDLVICDEAHKMSATFFGGDIRYTKRYHLGQLLSGLTRNFLLLTATPHNGKEEDFQLFLALLDGDRFEGRFRDPEAIYQSLRRRRQRLERRLQEEKLLKRGAMAWIDTFNSLPALSDDALDDLEEAPDEEFVATADQVIDQATASRTIAELEAEIAILRELEALAWRVRRSGHDRKWEELRNLLLDAAPSMRRYCRRLAMRSGRAGGGPAPRTLTTRGRRSCLTATSCRPSMTPSLGAARCPWRRNGSGLRATPATSTRWPC